MLYIEYKLICIIRAIGILASEKMKSTCVKSIRNLTTQKKHSNTLQKPMKIVAHTKPKLVVIGAGWGGFRFAKDINKEKYDVTLVSPRNHFLFTPLLPSTAVGTLEFHCIQEPVRTINNLKYYQASCNDLIFSEKRLHCIDAFNSDNQFDVEYDILVMAAGCETNTFGCPGVYDNKHVFFLKQLEHSRAIRNRLIECFERASSPGISEEERKRLLTFVIVGGGPTSVEFAAEVYDFLVEDVSRWYAELLPHINVKLIEAGSHILGSFHSSLVHFTEQLFLNRAIDVISNVSVKEIRKNVAELSTGEMLPFGLMVWSTGVKPVGVIKSIDESNQGVMVAKAPNGRLLVDDNLQVLAHVNGENTTPLTLAIGDDQSHQNSMVFALGDCAAHHRKQLPQLAQVAQQQGAYLAKLLNGLDVPVVESSGVGKLEESRMAAICKQIKSDSPVFKYSHLGSMASVGDWKAVFDAGDAIPSVGRPKTAGFLAFLLWRAAYWTKSVSLSNKMLIPMYWFKSAVFGRDISRF